MPKVHITTARKDYPEHGIKKGDTYYHWAFYRGPKMMSKTPPRRSQTTGSSNLSQAYAVEEDLEDAVEAATCPEDVRSALEDAVSAADEAMSGFDDTISNLESAFPGGCPALEEAQEKRDGLESWKDELESAKSEVDDLYPGDYTDGEAKTFEDLSADEQVQMLEAARELASVSLDI